MPRHSARTAAESLPAVRRRSAVRPSPRRRPERQTLQRLVSGPWDTGFDFGASKETMITERQSITLRMDSTNILNHPAFTVADQIVTSTTFGQVGTSIFGRRVFQFTLQYRF